MALIKCPDCGKEISDKSLHCPQCGCPCSDYYTLHGKIKLSCPECHKEVDKEAENCPNCGCPKSMFNKEELPTRKSKVYYDNGPICITSGLWYIYGHYIPAFAVSDIIREKDSNYGKIFFFSIIGFVLLVFGIKGLIEDSFFNPIYTIMVILGIISAIAAAITVIKSKSYLTVATNSNISVEIKYSKYSEEEKKVVAAMVDCIEELNINNFNRTE